MSIVDEPWMLIPKSNLEVIEKQVQDIRKITTHREILVALNDIDACLETNVYDSQVVPKQVV